MPSPKAKTDRKSRNGTVRASAAPPAEVLTLAEAAAFLRISEAEVLQLVRERRLPGRSVADDWRFLKSAVAAWLAATESPDAGRFWQTHFGALQGDPYLEDIVREAYRRRGRPEDGQP